MKEINNMDSIHLAPSSNLGSGEKKEKNTYKH